MGLLARGARTVGSEWKIYGDMINTRRILGRAVTVFEAELVILYSVQVWGLAALFDRGLP